MKCPNCGFENDEKNNECIICGASFINTENSTQENETQINYEEDTTQEHIYPIDNNEEYIPQDTEIYDNELEPYYDEIEPYENQTRTYENNGVSGFIDNQINNLKTYGQNKVKYKTTKCE